jgi:hypothetical protein
LTWPKPNLPVVMHMGTGHPSKGLQRYANN